MITIRFTKEQFDAILLLSRAPSFRGPADCNAYAVPRERMEVLRAVLADAAPAPRQHVYVLWGEFDPGEWEVLGAYASRQLVEAARAATADEGVFTMDTLRIDALILGVE